MRDHGGNLEAAMAAHGAGDWVDLSTGINRVPYPVAGLSSESFSALPRASAMEALLAAARAAYRTSAPIVALAGAQAAIQMVPGLRTFTRMLRCFRSRVQVLANERSAALLAL